jgi:cyclic 2,3-diphosphoglycerate synthetase
MKVIALVDGEHYPDVTRWGLGSAEAAGYRVLAALVVGGREKLPADLTLDVGDTEVVRSAGDPRKALDEAIRRYGPDAILDLSDEPVLDYRRRMELVAVALVRGIAYVGPDFRFDPPITEPPLAVPTLGVIGTGKRVAKTAIAGHVARLSAAAGENPVIVAMGRGGPRGPVVAGPKDVELGALLARVDSGEHASSDYLEDALTAGVTTVGARRCGGGLAGRPFVTNLPEAAERAVDAGADLVILEGSGSSIPTIPWDAGALVMPSSLPEEYLEGYLGPFRVLLSDLAVFIMGGGPHPGPQNLSTLVPLVRRLRADVRVAVAELQPVPLADVRGKDAFFATTAQQEVADHLSQQLERTAGCRVVRSSHHLADRAALEADLASSPPFDVLLTELKAAAVDVAARRALERGAEVVFVDNRPRTVGGDGDGDVDDLLLETVRLARTRAATRMGHG